MSTVPLYATRSGPAAARRRSNRPHVFGSTYSSVSTGWPMSNDSFTTACARVRAAWMLKMKSEPSLRTSYARSISKCRRTGATGVLLVMDQAEHAMFRTAGQVCYKDLHAYSAVQQPFAFHRREHGDDRRGMAGLRDDDGARCDDHVGTRAARSREAHPACDRERPRVEPDRLGTGRKIQRLRTTQPLRSR